MARPREFDIEQATEAALEVFWEHGYEGASLPELLEGMQLARGSLYKAFSDKKTLFLSVLERYEVAAVAQAVELLTNPHIADGWERIRRLFDSIVTVVEKGDRRGCLMCSAASGPASYDEDIAQVVNRMLNMMHAAFVRALEDADGRLPELPQTDIDDMSHMLVAQYVGLRVLVRSNVPEHVIRQSVAAIGRLGP